MVFLNLPKHISFIIQDPLHFNLNVKSQTNVRILNDFRYNYLLLCRNLYNAYTFSVIHLNERISIQLFSTEDV